MSENGFSGIKEVKNENNSSSIKDRILMKLKKNKKLTGVLIGVGVSVLLASGSILLSGEDEEYIPPKEFHPITVPKVQTTKTLPAKPVNNATKKNPQDSLTKVSDVSVVYSATRNSVKPEKKVQEPILPNRDIKLIGSTIKEAMKDAVREAVKEEIQKLKEELKAEIQQNKKRAGKSKRVIFGISDASEGNKATGRYIAFTTPKKIYVTSKVVYPDGEIILKTEEGIITVGEKYKGWTVRKITDKYIYLKKKTKNGIKFKKVPYRLLLNIGGV